MSQPPPPRAAFLRENNMGNRFGRNQKRRMREEIAHRKHALELANGLLRYTSNQRDELKKVIAEARYVLGDHIALPPELRGNHPHPLGGDWNARLPPKLNLKEFMQAAEMVPVREHVARMHALLSSIKTTDAGIHIRTTLDDETVAYNISHEALHSYPRDYITALITREIARSLSELLVKQLRGHTTTAA